MQSLRQMAENAKLIILEKIVNCYHECSFSFGVGEKFVIKKKRVDSGPALKITDNWVRFVFAEH